MRRSAVLMLKIAGSSRGLTSSHSSGIDTGARGRHRTENGGTMVCPVRVAHDIEIDRRPALGFARFDGDQRRVLRGKLRRDTGGIGAHLVLRRRRGAAARRRAARVRRRSSRTARARAPRAACAAAMRCAPRARSRPPDRGRMPASPADSGDRCGCSSRAWRCSRSSRASAVSSVRRRRCSRRRDPAVGAGIVNRRNVRGRGARAPASDRSRSCGYPQDTAPS